MKEANTDWTGIVHTCRSAVPSSTRHVKNALAIEVTSAYIGNAHVSGVFQIADVPVPVKTHKSGRASAEVSCLWFGRKPTTTWMHITLKGEWKLLQRYTGPVVENISKATG